MDIDNKLFFNKILKLNSTRVHKIKNSYGVRDGYKYYNKNKPKDRKYILSDSQYYKIIRSINNILRELLSKGEDIVLPHLMGRLEIRKNSSIIKINNGKVETNYPVDWSSTLKLWKEDEEAYKNKTLIKIPEKEIYKIYYNKVVAKYKNKSFYQFLPNRELKLMLYKNIKESNIDAYKIK